MSTQLASLEQTLLQLPLQARTFLVDRLISSINNEELDREDLLWVREVEDRYADYKLGNTKPIPLDKVIAAAEQVLK